MSQSKRAARSQGPTTHDLACRWYVAVAGRSEGPFTYAQVVDRLRSGELGRADHVWRPGFEDWIAVSARPDFVVMLPARPSLGVVPESLEAAALLRTDEVRFSRDVVSEAPDPDPQLGPGETMDLPDLFAAADASVARYEGPWTPSPSPNKGPTSAAEWLVENLEVEVQHSETLDLRADVAEPNGSISAAHQISRSMTLHGPVLSAAAAAGMSAWGMEAGAPVMDLDDSLLGDLEALEASALARARRERIRRRVWIALLVLLLGTAGLGLWLYNPAISLVGANGERSEQRGHAERPWDGATDSRRGPADPKAPEQRAQPEASRALTRAELTEHNSAEPNPAAPKEVVAASVALRGRAASSEIAVATSAIPVEVVRAHLVERARKPAPPPSEPPPRSAPRRYRVAATAAAADETPVAALGPEARPQRLSNETVGRIVRDASDDFGRCKGHDRLLSEIPAGTALNVTVSSGGSVSRVGIAGLSGPVARCLVRVGRRLRFPPAGDRTMVWLAFGAGGTLRSHVRE